MKIATRNSMLATYQAELVKTYLEKEDISCELIFMQTAGDRKAHPLYAGKGIFIKELQNRLLDKTADLAMHSLKDLPVLSVPPLGIFALLPRAPKEDVLIISPKVLEESGLNKLSSEQREHMSFDELKSTLFKSEFFCQGPIGTSSLRRTLQIKQYLGAELNCQTLRGNINSRLSRARNSDYACIILAKAGLHRLNLYTSADMFTLDPTVFVPSAGQGIIAVEASLDIQNDKFKTACQKIACFESGIAAGIERSVLFLLGSDCYTPVGVSYNNQIIYITTEVNSEFLSCKIECSAEEIDCVKNLLNTHENFYASFFEELRTSSFMSRVKKILIDKNFIEK